MRVWLALLAALTLLTIGPGATAGTSDPVRNGLIAARGSDGIYLIDARTTKATKVPGTADLGSPVWSPDGSLLAVEGWDESGDSNVYTIKPDGSDLQLVLKNAWSPSWSPDGERLVVVQDNCVASSSCAADFESAGVLVTVRLDGSDVHAVTSGTGANANGANKPTWSPDGKWIAFYSEDGALKLLSPDGADDAVRTIAAGTDSGWNLAWSPDSTKLAFDTLLAAHDYKQEVAIFDLATEKWATVPSRRPISSLVWSPDGKQFAFLSMRPMPKSTGGCGGEMSLDLWAMNVDGSNARRISKGSYAQPSWGTFQPAPKPTSTSKPSSRPKLATTLQPKPKPTATSGLVGTTRTEPAIASKAAKTPRPATKVIAPATTRRALAEGLIAARGREAIYLIDPQRGDARKIPGTANMAQPAWSPDGSLLAVEQADAVYTIRPDGSHPQLVLRNASAPSWSADGKRLYVERKLSVADDGSVDLVSVRPDGSDARPVDIENEDVYDASEPAFPPDGNWLAFFDGEGAIPVSFDSSAAAWSPDEKQLAFVSGLPEDEGSVSDANPDLWVVAADGEGKPLRLATGIYGRPSWGPSPDTRTGG